MAASSAYFFFPLALRRAQTGFRVFLGDFVQMEKPRLVEPTKCQLGVRAGAVNLVPDEQGYGQFINARCL